MNRENLVSQVKEIYSKLASDESQEHFTQATTDPTPEAYYENMLGMVINEINAGTFDSFESGQEIVNAVANDKARWLSDWDQNAIN